MRKKSAKNKTEDKSHKHSRRRRKSSSSESEVETPEVRDEPVEEPKTRRSRKTTENKEIENNSTTSGRLTRHSRRLAAISGATEEPSEIIPENLSPAKTGISSPCASGSPIKDSRKKDGTPDKHKLKDTWTVESANGSGVQKLKIRLQRNPEVSTSEEAESENREVENDAIQESVDAMIENTDAEATEPSEPVAKNEDNSLADIALPSDESKEAVAVLESEKKQLDSPSPAAEKVVEVENIELPPEPIPQPVINDVQAIETKIEESQDARSENVSEINLPTGETPEGIPLPDASTDADGVSDNHNQAVKIVETKSLTTENVEPEPMLASKEVVSSPQQVFSEQEDMDSQAELVLTVEENVMEEPSNCVTANEENSKKDSEILKKKSVLHSIPQVEMEEVYDYEHDDTREEGELSANEAMSPIHEVFKKLPAEERKRSWGFCQVFHFNRSNMVANEQILKERNIVKRVISKEDLESSESEDLIFVKEIREENIVHDIESETNTSFMEKDYENEKTESSTETRKRHTLQSDRIVEKPNKRHSKESRTVSGEGKTVLYITNLVRPFTVTQLRELLQRTGRIVENGFWIDNIKSKCYVQFENSDQAIETRHALHGIRWPVNNPKVLSVHFATPEELASAQAQVNETESQRKEPLAVSNHNNVTSQKNIDWKKHFEQYDERPRKVKDVREWDIGKPAHPDEMVWMEDNEFNKRKEDTEPSGRSRKDRDRERDRERDRKRRNEFSDDDIRTKRHRKATNDAQPPAEAKLLDDLFRRTKASPSIYWLPLSAEQIAVKQEARRKHLEEIGKQMKDRSGDREPRRRDRERRRSRR